MNQIMNKLLIACCLVAVINLFSCTKDEPILSSEADITSFVFTSITPNVNGVITGSSITADVPFGTDITNLAPTIDVSNTAKISPASGLARDFSNPVQYTVTAEDNITTQSYTVTVNVMDPDEIVISEFIVEEATSVDIDQEEKTITINVFDGTAITALVPTITTIPTEVMLDPETGVATDFTEPVEYSLTFGSTINSYTASVNFLKVGLNVDGASEQFAGNVAASTLPSELSDVGDNERGASMNSTHVYVASKSAPEVYYYAIDGSSVEASTLKKTDSDGNDVISGGVFVLSDVYATDNGIIASNMAWDGGQFKVYKWADNNADAEVLLSIPAVDPADGTSTIRFGDAITFSGDINGDGRLIAMAFPGFNSIPNNTRIFWWEVSGGAIENTTPNVVQLNDVVKVGNYPTASIINLAGEDYFLVNGAEITPSLFTIDGERVTNISTEALPARSLGAEIFEFNNATYLGMALPGSEGSNVKDAGFTLYNITGDNVIETLNAITVENVDNYFVNTWSIGQNLNGNVAADASVNVLEDAVQLFAFATNNGFTVINAPLNE